MHAILTEETSSLLPEGERAVGIATSAKAPFSSFDAALSVVFNGSLAEIWAPFDLVMERLFFEEAELPVVFGTSHSEVRGTMALDQESTAEIDGVPHLDLSPHFLQGVIDNLTTDEELLDLAEDVLLHDGLADTNVRLVWAPHGLSPDRLIAALDAFRDELPAHPDSDGALGLTKAFLASAGVPHAWGDGYVVSRGGPEFQGPGHVRWSEFDPAAILQLVRDSADKLVVPESFSAKDMLPEQVHLLTPGSAHRPSVGGWYRDAIATFVAALR
ncbi:hypothetical protein BH23BAC4_BH23BAC4_06850 [soil metagenome]